MKNLKLLRGNSGIQNLKVDSYFTSSFNLLEQYDGMMCYARKQGDVLIATKKHCNALFELSTDEYGFMILDGKQKKCQGFDFVFGRIVKL